VQRLLRVREGLKVIFMSGYSDPDLVDVSVLGKGVAFLQKPFRAGDLVDLVLQATGARSPVKT
jgi:FixJ family two-component response regulator